MSQLSVKQFHFFQQNLFEDRSQLGIFIADTQPLEMVSLFVHTFSTTPGMFKSILMDAVDHLDALFNFILNLGL